MTAKDQVKILKAGFMIIRKEVTQVSKYYIRKIKAKTSNQSEWHTLEDKFPSTAALEKRIKELLKDQMTVED